MFQAHTIAGGARNDRGLHPPERSAMTGASYFFPPSGFQGSEGSSGRLRETGGP